MPGKLLIYWTIRDRISHYILINKYDTRKQISRPQERPSKSGLVLLNGNTE